MAGILFTSVELGLLYALVVLGVFLTFRVLNFPDLTVDGSLVTGAAATAISIQAGIPGLVAILIGFIAGFLCGSLTALLHTRLGIGKILAGILSLSMLYTINLRLMSGPNLSLLNQENIIPLFKTPMSHVYTIVFLLIVVVIAKVFVDCFLQTEFGLRLRATGDNEMTAQSFAINTKTTKFIGVGLSNGLVGLAGGLIAQYQGFADINMGIGTIILGLAALMLGEAIISSGKISTITFSIIVGSILYQLIINFALRFGLAGTDLKFVTALIVVIALVVGNNKYLSYGK
jgi:putative tryptophan/tyrosine transport system permease protein